MKTCIYKNETYNVFPNGMIMRLPKEGNKTRPLDNVYTFGKKNEAKGYLYFSGEAIHRIVATAYHGAAPSDQHVVDHIDTNRCNNRPENLRWVTKLENILLNPITYQKIKHICGDVMDFLANPSKYRDRFATTNYSWMKSVTKEEASNCLNNLQSWVKQSKMYPKEENLNNVQIGLWIYNRNYSLDAPIQEFTDTLSIHCKQVGITKYPFEYLKAPKVITATGLHDYFNNLAIGDTFSKNQYNTDTIIDVALLEEEEKIVVVTKKDDKQQEVKPWRIIEIFFDGQYFIHQLYKSYFREDGSIKDFTLLKGDVWEGGAVLDDGC